MKKIIFLLILMVGVFVTPVHLVLAVGDSDGSGPAPTDTIINIPQPKGALISLPIILAASIKLILIVAGLIAFVYLLLGGIAWITSGGDKAGVEKARNQIIQALIGLIIVLAAWGLIVLVETATGIGLGFSRELIIPTFYKQ